MAAGNPISSRSRSFSRGIPTLAKLDLFLAPNSAQTPACDPSFPISPSSSCFRVMKSTSSRTGPRPFFLAVAVRFDSHALIWSSVSTPPFVLPGAWLKKSSPVVSLRFVRISFRSSTGFHTLPLSPSAHNLSNHAFCAGVLSTPSLRGGLR